MEITKLPHYYSLPSHKKNIKISSVITIAFFSAFFSRILDTLGAPFPINFLHFGIVPIAYWIAISKTKIKDKYQITTIILLNSLIGIFLFCILISAFLNNAGIINSILVLLLWVEPFLLLIAIICLPTQQKNINKIRKWIIYSFCFHTFLAFIQQYLLQLYRLSGGPDNIQGVFYHSGAGHVVGASVALTFGIYFLVSARKTKISLRVLVLFATFWHMMLADAKQVIFFLILGGLLLLATKIQNVKRIFKYILLGTILGLILFWCIQNLEPFSAFQTWIRPEIYGLNGEVTLLKSATFRIVPTFYDSFLNWLFGIGPGHTVDRMGGWMFQQYSNLLMPLGATTHPASQAVWQVVSSSWLGDQSSMFSPLFGWAALWGDFGGEILDFWD